MNVWVKEKASHLFVQGLTPPMNLNFILFIFIKLM